MYYSLSIYPKLDSKFGAAIDAIRSRYDPTAAVAKPHITVLFPTPARVGRQRLVDHIETALRGFHPLKIELAGFHKSPDHWLFLTLGEGEEQVRRLYDKLYSDLLEQFRRDPKLFVPHLGLGLFLRNGMVYDWNSPRDSDLDKELYEQAMKEASALPLPHEFTVDELHMTELPDELLEWATGRRQVFPSGVRIHHTKIFSLSH